MRAYKIFTAALLAASIALFAAQAARAEEPVWPSEAEERLNEVDNQVVDIQLKLAVARMHDNKDDVEKYGKEFKELQDERLQLLRDSRQLE
jgi:hypothetical protein